VVSMQHHVPHPLDSNKDQAGCYQCKVGAGVGGGDCVQAYRQPPGVRDRVLACLKDPKITQEGKSYCRACITEWYAGKDADGALAAKCVACLRRNPKTGFRQTCQHLG
jgi:hypothetical protein